MPLETWLAFLGASAYCWCCPAPPSCHRYSITHGRRARLPRWCWPWRWAIPPRFLCRRSAWALLSASAFWFTVVKTVGGLPLYLGFGCCAPAWRRPRWPQAGEAGSRWAFANTYLVTALNPKGIIFFVAFLPQFDPARRHGAPDVDPVDHRAPRALRLPALVRRRRRAACWPRRARLQPGRRRCRPPASGRWLGAGPEARRTRQGASRRHGLGIDAVALDGVRRQLPAPRRRRHAFRAASAIGSDPPRRTRAAPGACPSGRNPVPSVT